MGTCNYRNFPIFHIPIISRSVQVSEVALGTVSSNGPIVTALNLLNRTSGLQTVVTFVGTPTLCSRDLGVLSQLLSLQ